MCGEKVPYCIQYLHLEYGVHLFVKLFIYNQREKLVNTRTTAPIKHLAFIFTFVEAK